MSHCLLSASWRPRRGTGIPKSQGPNGRVFSLNLRALRTPSTVGRRSVFQLMQSGGE